MNSGGTGFYQAARSIVSSYSSESRDGAAHTEIQFLRKRLEQQNLLLQSLLAMCLAKEVFGEDEFRDLLDRIDELDGVKDGRLAESRGPLTCGGCGSKVPGEKDRCEFCGQAVSRSLLVEPPPPSGG